MWTQLVLLLLLVTAGNCLPQSRVIDGSNAAIEDYPFMVSLRGTSGTHFCGATIIDQRWILTAAHCVMSSVASQLTVQYAVTSIAASGPNIIAVKRIIIHEHFNPLKWLANDIALLELQGQLVYNYKTIAPVTLPESFFEIEQVPEGPPGVLLGWGFNTTVGSIQSILQMADLMIYSDVECNIRYKGTTTVDHICAGIDAGGKGQCSYDSGGPLLFNKSTQLGIVSWSMKPCTEPMYPGVYTKVSHYIDWIKKNMN